MRKFLSIILLFATPFYASEIHLSQKLSKAKEGSYLVLEQNKTLTFFFVREVCDDTALVEEVSISASQLCKQPVNFKEWFEKGAPGNTSWLISQLNLQNGVFEKTFSFHHEGFVDLKESNSFFTTLLNLRFSEVPPAERRRIGHPGTSRTDQRPVWNPRLIVEGKILENVTFSAFRARWPADGSELSRRYIEIYLPNSSACVDKEAYPLYFPYWLEIEGRIGGARIRVIDSGLNAHSPKAWFPLKDVVL